jgi:adenylate kinase
MILIGLKRTTARGWLLDGFPRNVVQETLHKALDKAGIKLDYVIEISRDRKTAADRIMGRRLV